MTQCELNLPPPAVSLGSDDLFDAVDPAVSHSAPLHQDLHPPCHKQNTQSLQKPQQWCFNIFNEDFSNFSYPHFRVLFGLFKGQKGVDVGTVYQGINT